MIRPTACRFEHFQTEWYERGRKLLHLPPATEPPYLNNWRKSWEWVAIVEALKSKIVPGAKGIGFAVGTEPLSAFFAGQGCLILGTDLADGGESSNWASTGQHAASLAALFDQRFLDQQTFGSRVTFESVDMNDVSALPSDQFDFMWSSCAIEHVGSLNQAKAFVKNAMRLLKPGGIAAHTTEYNCSSDADTITDGPSVIFRRSDILELAYHLRLMRCGMSEPDFDTGTHPFDLNFDAPPYFESGRPHVKLLLGDYVATSFLLVIHKA